MSNHLENALAEAMHFDEANDTPQRQVLRCIAFSLVGILECMEKAERRARTAEDTAEARSELDFNVALYKEAGR